MPILMKPHSMHYYQWLRLLLLVGFVSSWIWIAVPVQSEIIVNRPNPAASTFSLKAVGYETDKGVDVEFSISGELVENTLSGTLTSRTSPMMFIRTVQDDTLNYDSKFTGIRQPGSEAVCGDNLDSMCGVWDISFTNDESEENFGGGYVGTMDLTQQNDQVSGTMRYNLSPQTEAKMIEKADGMNGMPQYFVRIHSQLVLNISGTFVSGNPPVSEPSGGECFPQVSNISGLKPGDTLSPSVSFTNAKGEPADIIQHRWYINGVETNSVLWYGKETKLELQYNCSNHKGSPEISKIYIIPAYQTVPPAVNPPDSSVPPAANPPDSGVPPAANPPGSGAPPGGLGPIGIAIGVGVVIIGIGGAVVVGGVIINQVIKGLPHTPPATPGSTPTPPTQPAPSSPSQPQAPPPPSSPAQPPVPPSPSSPSQPPAPPTPSYPSQPPTQPAPVSPVQPPTPPTPSSPAQPPAQPPPQQPSSPAQPPAAQPSPGQLPQEPDEPLDEPAKPKPYKMDEQNKKIWDNKIKDLLDQKTRIQNDIQNIRPVLLKIINTHKKNKLKFIMKKFLDTGKIITEKVISGGTSTLKDFGWELIKDQVQVGDKTMDIIFEKHNTEKDGTIIVDGYNMIQGLTNRLNDLRNQVNSIDQQIQRNKDYIQEHS